MEEGAGYTYILFMTCLLSPWSCAYGLRTAATELGLKVLFYKIGHTCAYLAAPTFLPIAMEAYGFSHWLTWRRLVLIVLAPMIVEYLNITPHKLISLATSTFWFSGLCFT